MANVYNCVHGNTYITKYMLVPSKVEHYLDAYFNYMYNGDGTYELVL